PDLVEQAARWLIEAQSPLFVVGAEITRGKMNQAIVALAEKLAVPVCQGDDLFCDFPTTHPLAISATPRVSLSRLRFPRGVDLVISFGSSVDALPSGA